MSKVQSGIVLIVIAAVINFTCKMLSDANHNSNDPSIVGTIAILTFASLVLGLFGLVRAVMGARSKK